MTEFRYNRKTVTILDAKGNFLQELTYFQGPGHCFDDFRAFISRVLQIKETRILKIVPKCLGTFFQAQNVVVCLKGDD